MKYVFTAKGHPNILATHKTTLEITKNAELSVKGNCIVAVAADFSLQRLNEAIGSCCDGGKIRITIAAAGISDEVITVANKAFCDENEIVVRKGDFTSERTLGIHADKAAADLDRKLAEALKSPDTAVSVAIEAP